MTGCFASVNGIQLHYLEHAGGEPPLVLMPGLTANARFFDGLIQAGLSPRFRVLALDLRGRGLSDKPARGYSMGEHALDVLGLLDELGMAQVVLGGHSFGGLLAIYMAANHPERVSGLILMDAAARLHPRVRDLIKPSLARLGQRAPSWEAYLEGVKQAAHFDGWWDPTIESFFRADVETFEDGTVQARSRPEHIAEAVDRSVEEPWEAYVRRIEQPALVLNAPGPYGPPGTPPVVPEEHARETARDLARGQYVKVPGNHMTMMFGENARVVVGAIEEFLAALTPGP